MPAHVGAPSPGSLPPVYPPVAYNVPVRGKPLRELAMSQTASNAPAPLSGIIDQMVMRIVERFHPERIILIGSHARGGAGPDSDVDLLVVMRYQGSKLHKVQEIHRALAGAGVSKDVIVVTPEYFETYRDVVGTIAYPAAREGKVLYERSA